jgi:hypothetical protein
MKLTPMFKFVTPVVTIGAILFFMVSNTLPQITFFGDLGLSKLRLNATYALTKIISYPPPAQPSRGTKILADDKGNMIKKYRAGQIEKGEVKLPITPVTTPEFSILVVIVRGVGVIILMGRLNSGVRQECSYTKTDIIITDDAQNVFSFK